jgi:hypothetical protein
VNIRFEINPPVTYNKNIVLYSQVTPERKKQTPAKKVRVFDEKDGSVYASRDDDLGSGFRG